jgi:hypothetical protein
MIKFEGLIIWASICVACAITRKIRAVTLNLWLAGSYEEWRTDAASFTASVLGTPLDGWPGERWLDIRSPVVRGIMEKRIKACKDKGFLAVDPDNVSD